MDYHHIGHINTCKSMVLLQVNIVVILIIQQIVITTKLIHWIHPRIEWIEFTVWVAHNKHNKIRWILKSNQTQHIIQ